MNQMKVILFALQSLPLPPLQLYLLVHLWFKGSKFIIYDNVDLETVMIFIMMRKNGMRKSSDSDARIFSGALEPPDTCGSPSLISLTLTLTSLIWHNHTVAWEPAPSIKQIVESDKQSTISWRPVLPITNQSETGSLTNEQLDNAREIQTWFIN